MLPSLFTEHFGLVSDFLSECFTQLRSQSRVSSLQGRVYWGGALSGRDTNGVNKTVSGLLKLMYPGMQAPVSENRETQHPCAFPPDLPEQVQNIE